MHLVPGSFEARLPEAFGDLVHDFFSAAVGPRDDLPRGLSKQMFQLHPIADGGGAFRPPHTFSFSLPVVADTKLLSMSTKKRICTIIEGINCKKKLIKYVNAK